jgi:hypothetical protein
LDFFKAIVKEGKGERLFTTVVGGTEADVATLAARGELATENGAV